MVISVLFLFLSSLIASNSQPTTGDCAICQSELAKEQAIVNVCPSEHKYHADCLARFRVTDRTANSDRCPLCRQTMHGNILDRFPHNNPEAIPFTREEALRMGFRFNTGVVRSREEISRESRAILHEEEERNPDGTLTDDQVYRF
jgi:Ring finger domain